MISGIYAEDSIIHRDMLLEWIIAEIAGKAECQRQ